MKIKAMMVILSVGLLTIISCGINSPIPKCYKNDHCIEGYLCNQENQCVEVEQRTMEILVSELDDSIVDETYSFDLSLRGGLAPYTWSIVSGPEWLQIEEDTKTGIWRLTGIPETYQKDAVAVELEVIDSSIDGGQKATKDNLSIRSLYCLTTECSDHGNCNADGVCECDPGYVGNKCEGCDLANGYELNDSQECVLYMYKCETAGVCGAAVLKCECVDQECEEVEACNTVLECADTTVCFVNDENYRCDDCQGNGCNEGVCNGCSTGACCDNGSIRPSTFVCSQEVKYECSGTECGADIIEWTFETHCDGQIAGCNGAVTDNSTPYSECNNNQLCSPQELQDDPPDCTTCDHVCSDGECKDCSTGDCCDSNGSFEPSTTQCNSWEEYQCSSTTTCGASVQERIVIQHCSGTSSDCSEEGVPDEWYDYQQCDELTEICENDGITPASCVECGSEHVCSYGECKNCSIITFNDSNLEDAVRQAIDMPKPPGKDILYEHIENLTELDAGSSDITEIEGIQCLINLTNLKLDDNQISDISALADLTNLTSLSLSVNIISDINALANLTNLTYLNLGNNQIIDISALANLTNLEYLSLNNNIISDISVLQSLTNLTRLFLSINQISDISALQSLTNLTILYLIGNNISDISPLVENIGITGIEDEVHIKDNTPPFDCVDQADNIQALRDREVRVYTDCL